ncbi:hypothetical protein OHW74_16625 [Acinetobacter baumannii]|nr:hypothetical protein [Acinetobacter baumannii]
MSGLFKITNCSKIYISNVYSESISGTIIEANNSSNLEFSNIQAKNCQKGIVLNSCHKTKLDKISINVGDSTPEYQNFRECLLSILVRMYMRGGY